MLLLKSCNTCSNENIVYLIFFFNYTNGSAIVSLFFSFSFFWGVGGAKGCMKSLTLPGSDNLGGGGDFWG